MPLPPQPLSATRPPESISARHMSPTADMFLRRKSASRPRHGRPASAIPAPVPRWKVRDAVVVALVESVRVLVWVVVEAVKVNDAVEKLHVTSVGSVPHASVTVPV